MRPLLKKVLIGVGVLLLFAVTASVAIQLWLRSGAVRATVERQATAALGMPVRIGGASATVFPRLGLDLRNVEVGDPARAKVDQVSVATGFGLIFSRRVEAADVRLSGGYLDPSLIAAIASIQPPAATAASADAPFTIVSIRSIRLRNVDVVVGAERISTSLDASLTGDRLEVSRLTARVGESTFYIQGLLSSLARREGHFDIRTDMLPVDALLGTLGGLSTGAVRGSPFRITAAISAPVATLGSNRVESVTARLETTRSGLVFDPLTFDIDAGHFAARLIVDPSRQTPVIDARGNVTGVDVTRLQDPGAAATRAITGRLGARFALQTPAEATFAGLLGGARGSIDLEIRDGRMPGVEVIRQTVIRFANRNQPPPRGEASDAFSRLDASLALRAGTAAISSLTMKAADFDLAGRGTMALSTNRIALNVDVTLTEALSQQAGRDLYRYARDGQRIVLPAVIGGTLSQPNVSIDLPDAARRALKNRVEDEARSIFDRMMKRGRP